ncbi:MAG: SDR family oxidoreductase [Desulfobulbaceae bacterium]|nr:SDR family oxidoreductase [Desulfobulbaceae bacterium]
MKKILVTGATGYIGRRLVERLSGRKDITLRLLVRNKKKITSDIPDTDIIEGDTFNRSALDRAVAGIDAAYYLIHSMGAGSSYQQLDRQSAENFRDACIRGGVKKIIYLGGLGTRESASKHLLSRIETGEILSARDEIQTIWFRAGIIIGSGSAGFEIITNLVQKLPVMITPRWLKTRTQPIGIKDVLSYLTAALDLDERQDIIVDIGADPLDFKTMMLNTAEVMGLRRYLFPVPVLSPRISSYWLVLFTQVPYKIASALIEGLKSETLVLNDNAERYFPDLRPIPFHEAVRQAISELERDQVISRWCDSSAGGTCDVFAMDDPKDAILHDRRVVPLRGISRDAVFRSACSIGGEQGWFRYDFLWRIRGFLDKLFGGYGLSRGKRSPSDLRIGDALDFWKVADIKPGRRLLLLSQMKLPGKAWLEFEIHPDKMIQTAHFSPKGIWGRVYWYAVWPLHNFVFADLARQIVARAGQYDNPGPKTSAGS